MAQIIKEKSTKKVKENSGSKSKLLKGATEKKEVGRPKGSKTKNKATVNLNRELLMLKDMLNELRQMIGDYLPLTYLLLDGHFGNNYATVMSQQVNLQLISKLRYDSALYFPHQNPHPEGRCRQKYGEKLDIA